MATTRGILLILAVVFLSSAPTDGYRTPCDVVALSCAGLQFPYISNVYSSLLGRLDELCLNYPEFESCLEARCVFDDPRRPVAEQFLSLASFLCSDQGISLSKQNLTEFCDDGIATDMNYYAVYANCFYDALHGELDECQKEKLTKICDYRIGTVFCWRSFVGVPDPDVSSYDC